MYDLRGSLGRSCEREAKGSAVLIIIRNFKVKLKSKN